MEVYADDMLVKSREATTHISDLEETFATIRRYWMKLNPNKCGFGVRAGKFLGYMVTEKGVEVNPDQVKATQDMKAPNNIKDVQTLTGRIAALSRFLSRVAEKRYPFFKVLRKGSRFEWSEESEMAFCAIKRGLNQTTVAI